MSSLKVKSAVLLTSLLVVLCTISFANAYESWKVPEYYTTEDALKIGEKLGITWVPTEDGKSYIAKDKGFDVEQFRMGMDVELEHGKRAKITSVTSDNDRKTGKVALAHLNEFPDYYTRLGAMEKKADAEWAAGNIKVPIVTDPNMDPVKTFTAEKAKTVGEQLGIKWDKFDIEQFRAGMDIELEHGSVNKITDVTHNDPLLTGKIALGHLVEFPDYYTRLYEMEHEAEGK
jgi:major membrane immunogen (membrane-anchored lipoprotein)